MNESAYIDGDQPIDVYDLIGRDNIALMCEEYNAMGIKNIGYLAIKYSLDPDITCYVICAVLGLHKIEKPVTFTFKSRV